MLKCACYKNMHTLFLKGNLKEYMETIRFDELELNPKILRGIKDMGFEEATPIQAQGIPAVLSGRDVIGQAQTGTGKTAAFGIPVLESVDASSHKTQVIILSPTRELAIQVADEIRKLAKYMHGVKVLPVYGGQDISRQIKALKGGVQIIIGTRCLTWALGRTSRQCSNTCHRSIRQCFSRQQCQSLFWKSQENISMMPSTSRL